MYKSVANWGTHHQTQAFGVSWRSWTRTRRRKHLRSSWDPTSHWSFTTQISWIPYAGAPYLKLTDFHIPDFLSRSKNKALRVWHFKVWTYLISLMWEKTLSEETLRKCIWEFSDRWEYLGIRHLVDFLCMRSGIFRILTRLIKLIHHMASGYFKTFRVKSTDGM